MLICPRNCLQCNFNYSKVYSSQLVPVQHYFSSLQDLNPKMEKIWEFPDCIHMTKIGLLNKVSFFTNKGGLNLRYVIEIHV